ncbi:hypothetical protein BGP_1209 [Beggiatoa sp. PS]|nr:hypothetical protein BGP_1209 [Beggiatoa sp. PS]
MADVVDKGESIGIDVGKSNLGEPLDTLNTEDLFGKDSMEALELLNHHSNGNIVKMLVIIMILEFNQFNQ